MFISLTFFIGIVNYKATHPPDIISKTSSLSIVLPSVSTNTITEVKQDMVDIDAGNKDIKDFESRPLIFLPFYLFFPIVFIVCFGHEFGHYIMCRRFGVKVKEYGIGMLSLFYIPVMPLAFVEPDEEDFKKAKYYPHFSIISSGVAINLLMGIGFIVLSWFVASNFIQLLGLFNFGVAMFNSLPLGFLDGGLFIRKINIKLSYFTSVCIAIILFLLVML